MDARIQAWIDQENAWMAEVIRRHGWAIQHVGGGSCSAPGCDCPPDDEPSFTYTIGLFGLGHPELVVLGLAAARASALLNAIGEMVLSGGTLVHGIGVDVPMFDHPVIPETLPEPGRIVLGANAFYDRPPVHSVPVLQLTYADDEGRYPWDEGCRVARDQPRPGEEV